MTLGDISDDVRWLWMTYWMTPEWRWTTFWTTLVVAVDDVSWRCGWRWMTLDDVLDYCWITFVMADGVLADVLDDVGCFRWCCLTFSMTLDFGYVLIDVRWSFGWRITSWMTLYDDMDEVVLRFRWRWMTLDDVLDDIGWRMTLDDFGWRFRRHSMTFLDEVGWHFGWRWIIMDDVLIDVGCCFGWRMTFWMMVDDVVDEAGWRFG